jgi:hypothetical protein
VGRERWRWARGSGGRSSGSARLAPRGPPGSDDQDHDDDQEHEHGRTPLALSTAARPNSPSNDSRTPMHHDPMARPIKINTGTPLAFTNARATRPSVTAPALRPQTSRHEHHATSPQHRPDRHQEHAVGGQRPAASARRARRAGRAPGGSRAPGPGEPERPAEPRAGRYGATASCGSLTPVTPDRPRHPSGFAGCPGTGGTGLSGTGPGTVRARERAADPVAR